MSPRNQGIAPAAKSALSICSWEFSRTTAQCLSTTAHVVKMAQVNATRTFAQACSYCHSRKIKCIPTGKSSCQTCVDNNIKCRLRRPKKLGRPRGASQSAFPCRKQSITNYTWLPSRRGHETSPSKRPTLPELSSRTFLDLCSRSACSLSRSRAFPQCAIPIVLEVVG